MNEENFKILVAFDELPESPEKEKIRRPYLDDEESVYEFLPKAKQFLDSTTKK